MPPRRAPGPFVVRRARAIPRDLRAVADLLLDAGLTPRRANPERLTADLSATSEVAVVVAERRAEPLGIAIVRWLRTPGIQTPARAQLEAVYVRPAVRRQGIGSALLEAVVAEAEAVGAKSTRAAPETLDAGATSFFKACGFAHATERTVLEYIPPSPEHDPPDDELPEAPAAPTALRALLSADNETVADPTSLRYALCDGVFARFEPAPAEPTRTFWSGALAFRTRWSADCQSASWTTEGCIGTPGDEGDALRFDARTRKLRETYFTRPRAVRIDAERLTTLRAVEAAEGVLALSPEADVVALEPTVASLFDLALDTFVALTAPALAHSLDGDWKALALSPELSLLLLDERYAGWRVRAPVRLARPMGWPEVREASPSPESHVARLTELLYDWMTIDAQEHVRPDEASDEDEIAHMVTVRDKARALATVVVEDNDPVPEVARDIAAHIHWGWGFFRISG